MQTYKNPDDLDLWSAGVSERPLPGSMVGPVFGCIMGETFKNLRLGDRFWFENAGQPSSFTQGIFISKQQICEIKPRDFIHRFRASQRNPQD